MCEFIFKFRDLKLDNILIDEDNTIKIIDFGFSILSKKDMKLKMFCGTPSYMSPEIINKKEYYGGPSDMWSLGVILYAMLCGSFPFKSKIISLEAKIMTLGSLNRELYRRISRGIFSIPETVSKYGRNLILSLLNTDPGKRSTAEQVCPLN